MIGILLARQPNPNRQTLSSSMKVAMVTVTAMNHGLMARVLVSVDASFMTDVMHTYI